MGEPCGAPATCSVTTPPSSTPTRSHARISFNIFRSDTLLAKWPELARLPGLGDVHPPQGPGPIRLGHKLCGELIEEGPYRLDPPGFDTGDGNAVDAGGALVGGHVDPRSPHHVAAGELVVKGVEPTLRVLLGAAVEHSLERLEGVHTLVPSDGPSPKTGTAVLRAVGCARLM
jgi:hypothetical protein